MGCASSNLKASVAQSVQDPVKPDAAVKTDAEGKLADDKVAEAGATGETKTADAIIPAADADTKLKEEKKLEQPAEPTPGQKDSENTIAALPDVVVKANDGEPPADNSAGTPSAEPLIGEKSLPEDKLVKETPVPVIEDFETEAQDKRAETQPTCGWAFMWCG